MIDLPAYKPYDHAAVGTGDVNRLFACICLQLLAELSVGIFGVDYWPIGANFQGRVVT